MRKHIKKYTNFHMFSQETYQKTSVINSVFMSSVFAIIFIIFMYYI